ncbi:hypothetical protein IQ07DRAFT_587481 [Pyrenochaeta sp. DS3sAY3a]|nr:hypothetical protein IQ07DRAFT_587481 [Pyrenochaeta sp. DS3sAY3a]
MTPKACDHCYQNKEKCSFGAGAKACTRCWNLRIVCSTSRKKKRKGRRPVLKTFGHGSLQVWELGRDDKAEAGNAEPGAPTLESKDAALRGFLEVIRRRSTSQTALNAIDILTDDVKFEIMHLPFVMGQSFMQDFRRAIFSVLCQSGPIITDGYLAFLSLVVRCQPSRVHRVPADLRSGATALQNLRKMEITRPQDALCALFLGQALFVFETLTDSSTNSAYSILQSALISAKPWYPLLFRVPAFDTVTFCPVFVDIVGCLVHRKVPIIGLCLHDRVVVDRYAGLCSTLIPFLYSLCVQSHAAKSSAAMVHLDSTIPEYAGDCYTDIERSIELWAPIIPPDFLTAYDKAERQLMMIQSNAYRLAALLVIHRLRFPLGVQDTLGQYYAICIFHEISSFFVHSNTRVVGAFPVTFPLFISMLEVEGPGEDLLENLRQFPIQSICLQKLYSFVQHVRRIKESGANVRWFDLVENTLAYAVIP